MSDDLDRVMRESLEAEALTYQPSGDGLTQIRTRIDSRRIRRRWLLPSLALAAVAAGVAGVLVLPTLLPGLAQGRPPAAQPASPGATPAPSAGPSGNAGPDSSPAGQLPDLVTIWPYPSRREGASRAPADVSSGRLPYLTDARATALHFARDFVGVTGPLEVIRTRGLLAGAGVTLGRRNPNGQLFTVTTIYLVRVAQGADAPYVVVRADAPGLRVTDVRSPGQARVVTVSGFVQGVHESVQVRLLDKTGRVVAGGYDGAAGAEQPWHVVLGSTGRPVPAGRYAVAAQTSSDADGFISELYVRVYQQP